MISTTNVPACGKKLEIINLKTTIPVGILILIFCITGSLFVRSQEKDPSFISTAILASITVIFSDISSSSSVDTALW
jgi:hypothetical protein